MIASRKIVAREGCRLLPSWVGFTGILYSNDGHYYRLEYASGSWCWYRFVAFHPQFRWGQFDHMLPRYSRLMTRKSDQLGWEVFVYDNVSGSNWAFK